MSFGLRQRALFTLVALVAITTTSSQATTIPNGLEMGLAVATVPFDMAAHHYDLTDQKKTAALCHLTTDAISILNKACFAYNNLVGQQFARATALDQRDRMVNGAWTVRDITRFVQHLKQYRTAENAIPIVNEAIEQSEEIEVAQDNLDEDLFLMFDVDPDAQLEPEGITRMAYLWQVAVLPSLRGITAFALAVAQDDSVGNVHDAAGDLNSQQGLYLATAAHSLVRMAQEYTELESGPYKKVLAAALFAHTIWLIKEATEYKKHVIARDDQRQKFVAQQAREHAAQARRVAQVQPRLGELLAIPAQAGQDGECMICLEEGELLQLPCGHALQCRNCFIKQVNIAVKERDVAHVGCIHMDADGNCAHALTDADVRNIIGDAGDFVIDAGTDDEEAGNGRELLQEWLVAALPLEALDQPLCHACFLNHQPGQACADARLRAHPDDIALADGLVRNGAKVCPTPNCGYAFEKNGGCNWIRCARCHQGLCWTCLQPDPNHAIQYRNGRHVNPCGCGAFD